MSWMENFLKCPKGNIFSYAHINIKYFDFSDDFYIFENDKAIKTQEKC